MDYGDNMVLIEFGLKDKVDSWLKLKVKQLGRAPNYGAGYTNDGVLYEFEYPSVADDLKAYMAHKDE